MRTIAQLNFVWLYLRNKDIVWSIGKKLAN